MKSRDRYCLYKIKWQLIQWFLRYFAKRNTHLNLMIVIEDKWEDHYRIHNLGTISVSKKNHVNPCNGCFSLDQSGEQSDRQNDISRAMQLAWLKQVEKREENETKKTFIQAFEINLNTWHRDVNYFSDVSYFEGNQCNGNSLQGLSLMFFCNCPKFH